MLDVVSLVASFLTVRYRGPPLQAILGCLLGAASAAPALAKQEEVPLKMDSSPSWIIQVGQDVVLSGDWVDDAGDIQRLDETRILFVSAHQADGFFVVSSDGNTWEKIGRAGDGPGEYRYIRWVVPSSGRVHVFDAVGRRTVLDASFRAVHTNPLAIRFAGGAAILSDSTYVVNGSIPTSARVGYALHHFDTAGNVISSFDEPPEGYGIAGSENLYFRTLAAGADDALYSAHRSQYRIDSWNVSTRRLERSYVRDAEWFVPHRSPVSNDPDRPAKPTIVDMEEDAEGRLWLLIRVASERWADGFVATGAGAHAELGDFVLDDWNIAYDTVVEVVDLTTGCVLASQIVDDLMAYFVGPGWALSSREDARGNPVKQLWQLRLQRQSFNEPGGQTCK